jgi:hypothetical protein
VRRHIGGLLIVAALIVPALPDPSGALVSAAGSCVAGILDNNCTTPDTMDPTFRYVILMQAPTRWYVYACGSETCEGANWTDGSPTIGTLTAHGCPCYAHVSLEYPGQVVPNPVFTSEPLAIVTSLVP